MVFRAGVHFHDRYFTSEYTLKLSMITGTDDIPSQNVALMRIQHMVYQELTDALFVFNNYTKPIKLYRAAGMKVVELPEEPFDQVIGIMLYYKLNAVAEGRLVIHDIELGSDQGENMFYCHDSEENSGPFANAGWWNDALPKCTDLKERDRQVVKMQTAVNWKHFGLEWPDSDDTNPKINNVVVPFRKDDTK